MDIVHYYKRHKSGDWVFEDCVISDCRQAVKYLIEQRRAKKVVWRLYLDIPEDYELIKSLFFTPAYWEGRTWQQEADC